MNDLMSISQQLRALADMIEAQMSNPEKSEEVVTEPNEDHFEDHNAEPENDPDTTMVPPLQQNIELLKKIADVPSIYDDEEKICNCESECCCDQEPEQDELEILRKNAGLAIVASSNFPGQI